MKFHPASPKRLHRARQRQAVDDYVAALRAKAQVRVVKVK